jgi:predicted transcriptional regulator
MNSRNLTLKLDTDLYRAVKTIASQRDSSISALVTEKLTELVEEETGYAQARAHALELLDQSFDLGTQGEVSWSRDELHER